MHIFPFLSIALTALIPATLAQGYGGGWNRHRTSTTTTSPAPSEDTSQPSTSDNPSTPVVSTGGVHKGFNYGAATNGAATDFAAEFTAAQELSQASGFNSARLYTMIESGTTDTPSSAFNAAINTGTSLLLGIWCSSGQTIVTNELNALAAAVKQYPKLNALVVGISVGSEDLYRNPQGGGASAATILSYISQTRTAMSTAGVNWPLGHVDTANIWQESDGASLIDKIDWIGADVYPYYSSGSPSSLSDFTSGMAVIPNSKPVWVTETGWPTSGTFAGTSSVASSENAATYWKTVGCGHLFGATNTWWYTLYDGNVPLPFGVSSSAGGTSPKYSLAC
ncbi:hypothetical protein HO133_001122 [Letharia lupina]|uniref:glucan endo-1,3-beta-D-glucosidase n=1 Tax=Letharia lupina TaxID=560253 RepID=A0A8H6FBH6_9LECA|nr:uncharacterized protein HO133_001122 [Letharia lupina]KAF6222036.1 hypothetical protein HO133_001122 [Letharia lupina]